MYSLLPRLAARVSGVSLSATVCSDNLNQGVEIDGLLEVSYCRQPFGILGNIAVPRVNNHWYPGQGRICELLGPKLEPVLDRHDQVEQDEAGPKASVELLDGIFPVLRGPYLVSICLQDDLHCGADVWIIFDEENGGAA